MPNKMELKPICLQEDKSAEIYVSEDCQQLLNIYKDFYPKIGFQLPWIGYFIFSQKQIVGSCGFTGQPRDGRVELAYWTFKEFEGKGVASFACKELISIAYTADPHITIIAKTAPEHNASTKILQNNDFLFTEIVQDDEIGDAWLWVHKK
ncbi:GNAT family N-acetyltransferase [Elizabethkingia bruuniana]|nr:GNAT family N-acetyltransferase [Elizabethkingia bruuniana]QDZ63775.1 N-acetyltransferase [Elizabethkingia bruuniana]